jgi:FkbH-like protein
VSKAAKAVDLSTLNPRICHYGTVQSPITLKKSGIMARDIAMEDECACLTRTDNDPRETNPPRAMRLYEAQAVLFSPRVSRLALSKLQLPAGSAGRLRVNIWRNHAVEGLLSLMEPYCSYRGWQPDFRLGGYDDTLVFADRQEADAELLWLDSSRFLAHTSFADWSQWLEMRLRVLRDTTVAPIILATWSEGEGESEALQRMADSIPAVVFADMGAACADAGVPVLDLRSAALAGTPVGKAAQLALARKLACHWLPATLFPPLKAVVLDLDHTLHSGVLGEDGIRGVQLTPGHAEFQRYLKSLRQRGIFLALVSRNERADVEALFAERPDYPLSWEDFSATAVSWGEKAAAIANIANILRISHDSMLFVDDNPGELANVALQLPEIHTIFAHEDPSLTRLVVHFYPGLWRWKIESEDARRIEDLRANIRRDALAENFPTPVEYFRSLETRLFYRHNPQEQLTRLAELCNKTNQFNLALRRFNQAEVAELLRHSSACVTSVQLTDRLADSGIIAVVIAERQGEQLVVEELCVSCRALGRHLESTIILCALRDMPIFANCREVAFRVRSGPRNQPAVNWLARLLDQSEAPLPGLHRLPAQRLLEFVAVEGISIVNG